MNTTPNRARIRRAVVVLALLSIGQLGVLMIADEQYPGLVMPRFSWAGPPLSQGIQVQVPEPSFTYSDGTARNLTLAEVLPTTPSGHRSVIFQSIFSPMPPAPPARRAAPGKLEPPRWLFPGFAMSKESRFDAQRQHELRDWLEARARQVYGKAEPKEFLVNWYTDTYPASAGNRRLSRAFEGSFRVSL